MEKPQKSKFSFFRNLGWGLLFISLIINGGTAYLLKDMFYPYQFNVLENVPQGVTEFRAYHDFNGDGLSECIEGQNFEPNRHLIWVKSWNGGIVDQANYWERIEPNGLMFSDITGDGYQEMIAFTQKDDSLFLYAHDIISKQPVITRLFLFCVGGPLTPHYRSVDFLPACVASEVVYQHKVIIFAARSFHALSPRTIYAFDLDRREIIRQFETHSVLMQAFPYDLTGDGVDEIIVGGAAYGNVHYPAPYRDDKCWLFVLDQRLNPIFPPLSFSQYPSGFLCLPVEDHTERYVLAAPDYLGERNLYDYLYLVSSQGKTHIRTKNPYAEYHEVSPVASHLKNPTEIYGGKGDNQLIKLNQKLEIVLQVSTPFDKIRTISTKDINADGNEELLCASEKWFVLYDDNLDLMAKFPIPTSAIKTIFRETGKGKPVEIGLSVEGNFYLLGLSPNKMYSYFPFVFVVLTGLVFVLLSGSAKLFSVAANHNRILKYLHSDSSEGVLVIDDRCLIIFSNNRFAQMLNLQHPPAEGENAVSILNQPKIVEAIKNSIATKERVEESVMLVEDDSGFEVKISVQPYTYILKRGFNYLVVIRSAGIPSHSDQIHSWSKAVQKMAHDIKTPLSTVSLNLKVMQTRLEKIHLSEREHGDFSDDIEMMRAELDNIQSVTRNFLKFSNLDKPNSQAFDIGTVIQEAARRFQPYLNAEFTIEISIDNDVKPVWADPQQIEMVFSILMENALAATQGKGSIQVRVSLVQFLDTPFSESLEIEVADTGLGIKEEDKERIFEPYFSTKPDGTGMGLSIAKKIINDNGGSIEVYSKPNFGAVFRFSLPVSKDESNEWTNSSS